MSEICYFVSGSTSLAVSGYFFSSFLSQLLFLSEVGLNLCNQVTIELLSMLGSLKHCYNSENQASTELLTHALKRLLGEARQGPLLFGKIQDIKIYKYHLSLSDHS